MNAYITGELNFSQEVAQQITNVHGYKQRDNFAMATQEEIKSMVSTIWKTPSDVDPDEQVGGNVSRIVVGQQFALRRGFFAHYIVNSAYKSHSHSCNRVDSKHNKNWSILW